MTGSLQTLRPGDGGRVTGFRPGDRAYRQRLLTMGVTPGTILTVTRVAPLGDPVEIRLRGYALSLRKGEADLLIVEALA